MGYWCDAEKARFVAQDVSVTIGAEYFPDARKTVELEIEAVALVLSSLRTRYNNLTSVNRLPPEVYSRIFQHLRSVNSPLDRPHPGTPCKTIGWIKVTHVCHQWRTIALENPGLWSDIPFPLGIRWADEFLRRS